jgi:hypothetical protein
MHEQCLPFGQTCVGPPDISARSEQLPHHGGLAGLRGHGQRRQAVAIGRVDVGSRREKNVDDRARADAHGPVQGRRAVRLTSVDVGLFLHERAHSRGVARLRGDDDPGVRCGGAGGTGNAQCQDRRQRECETIHGPTQKNSAVPVLSPNVCTGLPK